MITRGLLAATLVMASLQGPAAAGSPAGGPQPNTQGIIDQVAQRWFRAEWTSYASKFMTRDGRIVDNANGDVSHSEGQGYGLLLARIAGDAERFELIWQWTKRHLNVRPDHLLSWKWDPKTGGVTDPNNATDADILIAWALADGARRFGRPDYLAAAKDIANALGTEAVKTSNGQPILLPAVAGFGERDQPDGPVINLSYWVFPAFETLKEIAPDHDWDALRANGLAVLAGSRFGPMHLPADWQSNAAAAAPAKRFPPRFGYDAIRIPLYLAWDGRPGSLDALRRFAALPSGGAAGGAAGGPYVYDLKTGAPAQSLSGSGYRLVLALARCSTLGVPIDPDIIKSRDALYYPETLRLLSLAVIQERFPQCL